MSSFVALAEAPKTRSAPLSVLMASTIAAKRDNDIPTAAREKLKVCLLDFLACAFETHTLPWARQAQALATVGAGPCSIIRTSVKAPAIDAVFANCVAGHGLVREDMHTGSVTILASSFCRLYLPLRSSNGSMGAASPRPPSSGTRSAAA